MYTTTIKITGVSEIETITGKDDRSLTMRWIVGESQGKQMAFKAWNDLASYEHLITGHELTVEFTIISRLHHERYFTDLTITRIVS